MYLRQCLHISRGSRVPAAMVPKELTRKFAIDILR